MIQQRRDARSPLAAPCHSPCRTGAIVLSLSEDFLAYRYGLVMVWAVCIVRVVSVLVNELGIPTVEEKSIVKVDRRSRSPT